MAKINFMDRDNVLREYELTDEAITMGREATNKVVIADPSVSRAHAWIEKRADGYYLIDKNSSNGTYVNGKKVTQQKLNHNDKVNLGSASLVFEDEDEGATFILNRGELPDLDRTGEEQFDPNERLTDALSAEDVGVREDRPLPPPPPRVSSPPAAPPPRPSAQISAPPMPPPPAPAPAPAPQAAKPDQETPVGILCPSCRKVVEQGARFCPFCGASLGPSKAPAPAPPAAAPPQKAPAPPLPSPPQVAVSSARPPMPQPPPVAPQRPPAAPAFGAQPPMPSAVPGGRVLNYAGFGVRLVAAIIDSLLLSALMIPFIIIVAVFMMRMQTGDELSPLVMVALFGSYILMIVISLAYQLIFIGKKGATPGKKFMKLRVTFPDGTYPIGIGKAFLRMIGYMISGMICYIGFLMIIFDKEQHRALHDKIAGTVVIRES
jgi:uncharacterized RDD family membrane protein YckC/pSer/pThr/pTyr-binding forkhead associated (FHA) protein